MVKLWKSQKNHGKKTLENVILTTYMDVHDTILDVDHILTVMMTIGRCR